MKRGSCTRLFRDESGMALVEFIGVAIVLMIPLIYLASMVSVVARGTMAADASARAAARMFVISATDASAKKKAKAVVARVIADHELTGASSSMSLSCASSPCLTLGSSVTVTVVVKQALTSLPTLGIAPRVATSTSSHTMVVEEMRKP